MTHLLVHLVEEIGVLGPLFLHNMFPFERFKGVLKKYVHNRARPEGSISKGYRTEEVIEFCADFIPDLKPIGVPESRYEGRLRGKGKLQKKATTCMYGHSFTQAHYTVLYNSSLVVLYIVEHKNILRSEYPEQREVWIDGEHIGWSQTRFVNVTAEEQLYLFAKQPSLTILTYQGYEINENTFYTFARDKKSTNQNSGVRFDAVEDNEKKVTYYGYIEEIWELDYGPNFKVPLFRCKWFNLRDGVHVDPQYSMTTVDLKNLGHEEDDPPRSNFNEASRRLWWRGRTLQSVMAYRGPRLQYPQSQPSRAHPPRFDYRDPKASDDDIGLGKPFCLQSDGSLLLDVAAAPQRTRLSSSMTRRHSRQRSRSRTQRSARLLGSQTPRTISSARLHLSYISMSAVSTHASCLHPAFNTYACICSPTETSLTSPTAESAHETPVASGENPSLCILMSAVTASRAHPLTFGSTPAHCISSRRPHADSASPPTFSRTRCGRHLGVWRSEKATRVLDEAGDRGGRVERAGEGPRGA
ncbi:hypothetical protein QYE76_027916 [Lolium multiflorum]|uniref:DUF4218 domain-containing protein n=1 Tax=Lolium multiflorum TaxID=4521 RepID=A0AAD8QNJ0_LOLMU|nr:hypothetical protein QYE76_027916 [Lolium multiflorum]